MPPHGRSASIRRNGIGVGPALKSFMSKMRRSWKRSWKLWHCRKVSMLGKLVCLEALRLTWSWLVGPTQTLELTLHALPAADSTPKSSANGSCAKIFLARSCEVPFGNALEPTEKMCPSNSEILLSPEKTWIDGNSGFRASIPCHLPQPVSLLQHDPSDSSSNPHSHTIANDSGFSADERTPTARKRAREPTSAPSARGYSCRWR
jgi:hypothetical protein